MDIQQLVPFVGPILGMLVFFGCIAMLVWLDHRKAIRLRQIEKDEHLALAERGQPVSIEQLHYAEAEKARYQAIGAIGAGVGISLACAAGLATVVIVLYANRPDTPTSPLLWVSLIVMWPVVSAAVLVTSVLSLQYLRRLDTARYRLSSPVESNNVQKAKEHA
jgi:hypothetical protein